MGRAGENVGVTHRDNVAVKNPPVYLAGRSIKSVAGTSRSRVGHQLETLLMQVSGKILVLTTFAIGFAMAGGAWWYNFQQSRLTAAFWGPQNAVLIVGSDKVELLEVGEPFDPAEEPEPETGAGAAADSDDAGDSPADETRELLAGRRVLRTVDITTKPGVIHLRHALTYDDNFTWGEEQNEPLVGDSDWKYALRFTKGEQATIVLFTANFTRLGHLDEAKREVAILPCPRLGPVFVTYLSMKDVGALPAPTRDPAK
jgi:hypothetical protein